MNSTYIFILDILKRTQALQYYKLYNESLYWDRNRIKSYQRERVKQLIKEAYLYTPYYKNLFDKNSILPQDINSIEDLKKIPILERQNIQKFSVDMISSKLKINKLFHGSSSGTTGLPLHYYKDKNAESANLAALYFLFEMTGKKLGEKSIHIWGNASSIKRWNTIESKIKNLLIKQKNIPSTLINEDKYIKNVINTINTYKPKTIDGYPSAIYTLAIHLQSTSIISSLCIEQVITTSENLENYQREIIENIIAPTADLYGSGEIMGVAIRPSFDTKYYILDTHVLVETIESNIPGMKEILITDIDNFAMPLIRYKIGDMIDEINEPEIDSRFPYSWFSMIYGRSADIIELNNGMKFHPVNIFGGTLFRKYQEIRRHKVIWDGHKLELVFEIGESINKSELFKDIELLLKPYDVNFLITYTDKLLPSKNGKFKYLEIV